MLEMAGKVIWILSLGAFGIGAWVAGIQMTVSEQGRQLEAVKISSMHLTEKTAIMDLATSQSQGRILDLLGRMDERLKNIEKYQRR